MNAIYFANVFIGIGIKNQSLYISQAFTLLCYGRFASSWNISLQLETCN